MHFTNVHLRLNFVNTASAVFSSASFSKPGVHFSKPCSKSNYKNPKVTWVLKI